MSRHTWQQNVTTIMWPFQQQGTLMQPDNAFFSISWKSRMSRHTWQQNVTTIMWPLRSATTDSKTPYNEVRANTPKAA